MTVAISDAFNAAGHLLAAQLVRHREDQAATLGFLVVALWEWVGLCLHALGCTVKQRLRPAGTPFFQCVGRRHVEKP